MSELPRSAAAIHIWWEIEAACNLNCTFCYNPWRHGARPTPPAKPTSVLVAQLERLAERFQCQSLTISGGEPLLHPGVDAIVSKARELGIPTILSTNGLLLTRTRLETLRERGIGAVQISLHSHRRDTHNRLVGGIDCWDQAIDALATARAQGVRAIPTFVATQSNVAHFKHVVEICEMLDLPAVIFNRVVRPDFGFAPDNPCASPTNEQIIGALDEADAVASDRQIVLGVPLSIASVDVGRWQSVVDSSCPIMKGQSKWILGPDLAVKRCSHGVASIGSLDGEGFERLVASAGSQARSRASKSCSRLHEVATVSIDRLLKSGDPRRGSFSLDS